ncbi:hypothetical protein C5E41_23675 [Nocardia nova]|nr:hypothetical protein C5E41_23675 [Nocardia nova]
MGAVDADAADVAVADSVVTGMWDIAGVVVLPESFGASNPIRTKTGSEAASRTPAAFRPCRRAQSRWPLMSPMPAMTTIAIQTIVSIDTIACTNVSFLPLRDRQMYQPNPCRQLSGVARRGWKGR